MKQYFKRSTAWMLCLALLMGLVAGIPGAVIAANAAEAEVTVEENNLILNPSFEDYAITNWTIEDGAVLNKVDGNYVLNIKEKDASATSDAVLATAGYTYVATAAAKGAGKISVVFYDAAGAVIGEESAEATSAQWSELKVEAVSPAGTVKAAVKLASTTAETASFDNAALVLGAAAGEPELLNGDFEGAWNATATVPSSWEVTQPTTGDTANTYAFSAQEEIEGRGKVLAFNRDNQKLQFASKKFDVVGGKAYTVTFDTWMDVANYYQIYIQMWDAEGTKLDPISKHGWTHDAVGDNFPTNEWKTISATTALPADAVTARILITSPYEATGTVKFDNFAVELSKNVIDGGYESAPNRVGQAFGYTTTSTSTVRPWINTNADYVRTGNQSIAFTDGGWNYTNYINVIPGETYTSSIYIKSTPEAVAGWTSSLVNLIYFYDAAGNQLLAKQGGGKPTSDAWTEVTATATAPEGAAFAKVMFYSAGAHLCYGDDITFVQTSNNAGSIALANADFETEISGDSNILNWMTGNTNAKPFTGIDYESGRGYYATHYGSQVLGTSLRSTMLSVTPGQTYAVSMDVKGSANTEWIQICLKFYDENAKEISGSQGMKQLSGDKGELTDAWVTATFSKAAPEGAVTARIFLSMAGQYGKNADGIEGTADDTVNTVYGYTDLCMDNASVTLVCEHDFTGSAVVVAPTCGTEGTSTITCPTCGAKQVTTVAATGAHTWDAGVVTEPTCNKGGYTTYTCSACGGTKIADETAAGAHVWNDGEYTAPTTSADGYTTYICTLCGESKIETDAGSMLVETAEIVRDGEVVGTYYTMAQALQNLQDGDTINLLADTDEGFNLPMTGVNNITFNGNDHTVSGVIRVQHTAETASGLTIQNVVFDATEKASYLVISLGYHEDLTIQDCIFQNGAYISTYNTTGVKNLTLTGCIFDGVSNAAGTASAIVLSKVENAVISGNEILSVEWNAIQAGYGTGTWEITDNTFVWDSEADGVLNLHSFESAKITVSGNTYEIGSNTNNIVNVQVAATDVCLVCEDDVKVNTELFAEIDGNTYCTGHKDVDGVCSVCGATLTPTDASLVFVGAPGLSFQDYIGMQIMARNKTITNLGYTSFYVEITQVDYEGNATTTQTTGAPYGSFTFFEQQILSWSMTEQVTMTLYGVKDGVAYKGQSFTTSVEALALEKIPSYVSSGDMARAKALVDMLNFGSAVQTAYVHNENDLPNADLGDLAQYGTTGDPEFTAVNDITGKNTITVYSNNISMQSKVEFQFMVKTSALEGKTVVAKMGDADATVAYEAMGSFTIIRVACGAAYMRETFTIYITDANGALQTCTYNVTVEGYASQQLTGEKAPAMLALIRYGDAVAAIG